MTTLHECFAIVTPGLEETAAREMRALGLREVVAEAGGVNCRADDADLLRANLHLRSVSRILVRAASFKAKSFAELERRAKAVPWTSYLRPGGRAALRVTCRKSRLYHSDAVAERLARAIGAAARGATVGRVRESAPDDAEGVAGDMQQLFVVRLDRDVCTISADSSGELLHRRGYRLATAKAPIRETIAAAVLLALGYDGSVPLVDPMCGSGTFPIEAALIARNIPPGMNRAFVCEFWPGFDAAAAQRLRSAARAGIGPPGAHAPILASDRDAGAVSAAAANAERAAVAGDIAIARCALSASQPPPTPGLLVCNPPYGVRVSERKALRDLYAQIGNLARSRFAGWRVALILAERSLETHTGLPLETILSFSNGGIGVRLVATPPADVRAALMKKR